MHLNLNFRQLLFNKETHRFFSDMSDLGLRPGEVPETILLVGRTGKAVMFEIYSAVNVDGEGYSEYKPTKASIIDVPEARDCKIRLFND